MTASPPSPQPTRPRPSPGARGRALTALLAVAAGMLVAGALLHPGLRGPDGHLASAAAFGVGTGLVLLGALAAHAAGWRRAAPWLVWLGMAQAAALQLVDAGSRLHYEHLLPALAPVGWAQAPWIGVLALAAVVVALGLRVYAPRLRSGARALLAPRPAPALAAVAVLVLGTAAFPSREPGAMAREFPLALVLAAFHAAAVAVLLAALYADLRGEPVDPERGERWDRLLAGPAARAAGPDRLALACALWTTAVATLLVLTVYERHPHVTDEVAYLLHARIFASGQLSIPAPRVEEAWEIYLVACDAGRCMAPTYPGWPAVLALGVRAGIPWLVNPLLGGLGVYLAFVLVRDLFDRRSGRLTALLLAASPWYLLVSMSFMTHALSLVCALAAAIGVVHVVRGGRALVALPAGLAIGALSLVRPLEGLCVAGLLGVASLVGVRPRGIAPALATAGLLAVGAMATGALNLVYNQAVTGDFLEFPIMAYADEVLGPGRNALGFGPDKGVEWGGLDPFPGHGLRDVLVNAQLNTTGIQRDLFGWGIGSLVPLVLLWATGRLRVRRREGWLFAAALVTPAVHSLYWYSGGPDFAARYWYLSIVPLVALTALGLVRLSGELEAGGDRAAGRLAWLGPLALSALAIAVFLPWRAIDKYAHFRGMRGEARQIAARPGLEGHVVLVRGDDFPDAASLFVYNDLDPESSAPLFVWARDAELESRVRRAYPDRSVRVIEGPSRTRAGYRWVPEP